MSVDLFDGKAISVKTWEGWRERTMKGRTWSIDAYKDGECVFSQGGGIEKWMERKRWTDRVVKSNLKSLRMNKRREEKE